MLTSKTRRVGDSIEITLPVDENVEILPDTAQLIQYHDNGAIVLIPKTDENQNEQQFSVFGLHHLKLLRKIFR